MKVYLHINPDDVKLKKRQRKTETEVRELRVKLAQATKSVVLSNREVRLLRYSYYGIFFINNCIIAEHILYIFQSFILNLPSIFGRAIGEIDCGI